MRDLLYKNLTSNDKKRKIIASSEIADKDGVHSVVHRHFTCMVKEISGTQMDKPQPALYVVKTRNTRENREHFFYKIKGSVFAVDQGKLYLILFMHTLSIQLTASAVTLK